MMKPPVPALLTALCLLCAACGGRQESPPETEDKVAQLEKQVEALSAEVRALEVRALSVNPAGKKAPVPVPVNPAAAPTPLIPAAGSAAMAPTAAASAAPPLRGNPSHVPRLPGDAPNSPDAARAALPPESAASSGVPGVPAAAAVPSAPGGQQGVNPAPPSSVPAQPLSSPAPAAPGEARPAQQSAAAPQAPPTRLALPPETLGAPPAPATASGLPAAARGEEAAYKEALALVSSGRAEEGRARFMTFLQEYPDGRYAANAHYWIGESLYSQRNYADALAQFKETSTRFPRHHKTADALLKAGMVYQKLGDKENAASQFRALLKDFPQSEAAAIARNKGWGR